MTSERNRGILFWSAVLALSSLVPFSLGFAGLLPSEFNQGIWGLALQVVLSPLMALMALGCMVITLSMIYQLFKAAGPLIARLGWLFLFFWTGWFGCALYYFVNYRRRSSADGEKQG